MCAMASQPTSLTIVYSAVYSGADQRKDQSSAALAFVQGIHRGPVNSRHKWPVTRKMFPFGYVIMTEEDQIHNGVTLHVAYPILSIPCLLMLWLLKERGHKRAWYRLNKPEYSGSSIRRVKINMTSGSLIYSSLYAKYLLSFLACVFTIYTAIIF